MVAPNYPHCPRPSGHGCQSDIPKSGGRGTTSMKQDHQLRSQKFHIIRKPKDDDGLLFHSSKLATTTSPKVRGAHKELSGDVRRIST